MNQGDVTNIILGVIAIEVGVIAFTVIGGNKPPIKRLLPKPPPPPASSSPTIPPDTD